MTALCIGALLVCTGSPLLAQEVTVGEEMVKPQRLEVYVGRSKTLHSAWPTKQVAVSDPSIADVQVVSPNDVLVVGKAIGSTELTLWGENDQRWHAQVLVTADLQGLTSELSSIFPGSQLKLTQVGEVTAISGVLRRAEHAVQLHDLLDTAALKYVDMTSLAGVQQVMIQVRVAEASRTAIRALGVNFFHTDSGFFGASQIGPSGSGAINPVNIGVPKGTAAGPNLPFTFIDNLRVSPGVTLFAGIPDADFQIFLQALAENQYLRILAEPNLVALSGEEASFLAGGEFPIPIVQGGTADSTAITIEYREFGVRLNFRPTVLGDGSIHLLVAPEVSELSDVGAVQIQGFRIPSIVTRRAETTVQLNSGQTFAMAGLLDQSTTARSSQIPGLGALPVLGPLFRSVRYERNETELVVLVTATLVEPLSLVGAQPVPGDLHVPPTDWELFYKGKLEGEARTVDPHFYASSIDHAGLTRLKGPGAWVSYSDPAAISRADLVPTRVAPAPKSDAAAVEPGAVDDTAAISPDAQVEPAVSDAPTGDSAEALAEEAATPEEQ
jgi:pilus assembly protein CpaC